MPTINLIDTHLYVNIKYILNVLFTFLVISQQYKQFLFYQHDKFCDKIHSTHEHSHPYLTQKKNVKNVVIYYLTKHSDSL